MPIYKPEDYGAVLDRIKEEVKRQNKQLGPVLSEEEICAFEQTHQITLPEGYRRFLLEAGDGGYMFGTHHRGYRFLPLGVKRRVENYAEPFRYQDYWADWENLEDGEEPPLGNPFTGGTLELIDIGCGQTFELVITGPCRGEVWHFSEMGVQPCCQRQDFLGWFERWLTDGDGVNYFAEFPYPEDGA